MLLPNVSDCFANRCSVMNLFELKTTDQQRVSTPNGVPPLSDLPDYDEIAKGFSPSAEQRRVFGFVEKGSGDGVIKAVAGSGKTSTLLGCARLTDPEEKCLVCTFNKSVKKELEDRLPIRSDNQDYAEKDGGERDEDENDYTRGVKVTTLHGLGLGIIKDTWTMKDPYVKEGKLGKPIGAMVRGRGWEKAQTHVFNLMAICERVKQTCIDPWDAEKVREVARKYEEGWKDGYAEIVKEAISESTETAREEHIFDYEDMLYLPLSHNMVVPKYDWVMVDEAQDLTEAEQRLTMEICKSDGRRLYVGDEHQAIYGFRGADPKAVGRIQEKTDATVMDLDVSFRCPVSHVSEAQKLVDHMRPAKRAIKGTLQRRALKRLPSLVKGGDLVLCRRNAPLVKWCLRTIGRGTPAYVKGKDMAENLLKVVTAAESRMDGDRPPLEALQEGLEKQEAAAENPDAATRPGDDDRAIDFKKEKERIEAVRNVLSEISIQSIKTLRREIEDLCKEKENGVCYSTIHKAKGREAERVLAVRPFEEWADEDDQEWVQQQAQNLRYVMLTRSTDTLILLSNQPAAERSDDQTGSSETEYLKIQAEKISKTDRLEHKKYGVGEVITVKHARDGTIMMDFDNKVGFREVELESGMLRWR